MSSESKFSLRNTVLNYTQDMRYSELVFYKTPFQVPKEAISKDIPGRVFRKTENGYVPVREYDLAKLDANLDKSSRRAMDKVIRYALANDWTYFITLTVDPEKVSSRFDSEEIYKLYRNFKRSLFFRYPDAKYLAVPEYHKKRDQFGNRALHYHVLLWLPDGQSLPLNGLVPGERKYPLFYIDACIWDYGFATAAFIDNTDPNSTSKITYYLAKYVSKSVRGSTAGDMVGDYNAKRYYHSKNLEIVRSACLDTVFTCPVPEQAPDFYATVCKDYFGEGWVLYKETEKMYVYRRIS